MLAGSKYLPDAWKHEIQHGSYFAANSVYVFKTGFWKPL